VNKPRSSGVGSKTASKILRMLYGKDKEETGSNEKRLAFARLDNESKIKFLKKKLYRLYDQSLQSCDQDLNTELVDRKIDKLEDQIQEIQMEMWK